MAEIKYSVCPRPFKRPREAWRVRNWYWTGKGWAGKGREGGGGKGRIREVKGTSKEVHRLLKSFLVGGGWWVAEIKYSVCPRPFKRPREARR